MHGYGKIFFKDGSIYQGNFKNNLRDGTGILRSTDGSQQRVIYQKESLKTYTLKIIKSIGKILLKVLLKSGQKIAQKQWISLNLLTKQELLQKSQLNADIKKLKVTDVSVFVEEEQYN